MVGAPLGLPAYSLEGDSGSLTRSYSSPTESSGVRNRFPTQQETRAALFGNRGQGEDNEELDEKQLDEQRVEQEDITTDMLALAQALKENSVRFSEELKKEKGVLDLATEALDKNVLGIEGAGRKMGQLRRNENVGWLWGILYPAIIVALVSSSHRGVSRWGLMRDAGLFYTHHTVPCTETALVVTPYLVLQLRHGESDASSLGILRRVLWLRNLLFGWSEFRIRIPPTPFFPFLVSLTAN